MKDISDNDLSELQSLVYELEDKLQKYSHVEDYVPHQVKKQISIFCQQLKQERDRREDLF